MKRYQHSNSYNHLSAFPLLQVHMLWIPYIIFRNTDSDEAVTVDGEIRTLVAVKREGGFVRSGPDVADEVLST